MTYLLSVENQKEHLIGYKSDGTQANRQTCLHRIDSLHTFRKQNNKPDQVGNHLNP